MLFTVAASSVMSAGEVSYSVDEGFRLGEEIWKASRIKIEGVANIPPRTAPK